MKTAVLYGSSRANGNTESLAQIALKDLPHRKIFLRDLQINPIVDQRHHPGGFSDVDDDYLSALQIVMSSDIILFATPLYWYGMSGLMKNFVDRWSQSLRSKTYDFKSTMKSKKAYVLVVGGDDPREKGKALIEQFRHIFDYMGMEFAGWIIAEGNKPGDVLTDKIALHQAKQLNEHLRIRIDAQR